MMMYGGYKASFPSYAPAGFITLQVKKACMEQNKGFSLALPVKDKREGKK